VTGYPKLQTEHQRLLAQREAGGDPQALLKDIRAYITQARVAAGEITTPRDRDQLRANLRFWAAFVFDQTGTYPDATLRPSNLGPVSEPRPSPRWQLWWVWGLLAAGLTLLIVGRIDLKMTDSQALMMSLGVAALSCGILTVVLGYFLNKIRGVVILLLGVLLIFAFLFLPIAGMALSDASGATENGARMVWELSAIMFLIGLGGARLGHAFNRKATVLFPGLWVGFCLLFWAGHALAGWAGVLVALLLATLFFWGVLFMLSGRYLLPLQNIAQRRDAMRSLLAFSWGTNRPYHVVEDRKTVQRASGDCSEEFFTGPGIVLTDANHAVAIGGGLVFRSVPDPGLAFTHRFETIQETFDLRPQLRSFPVQARTKDGIEIKVITYTPFQIDRGNQQPQLGASLPFYKKSIFKAARAEMVEHKREGQGKDEVESRDKQKWDELVPLMATRILRNILAEYTFDELCEPFNRSKDPRTRIRTRFLKELRAAVRPWGLYLIGGGFSNLFPADDNVLKMRVENWQAKRARQMLAKLEEGEASALRFEAQAHTAAHAELITRISDKFSGTSLHEEKISNTVIVMRFIDAMEEMVSNEMVRRALPGNVVRTLDLLRETVNSNEPSQKKQGITNQ